MKKRQLRIRFLKFCVIGVVNTVLHFSFFLLIWGLGVHYLISQTLSFFLVNIVTFAINKYWTFGNKNPRMGQQLLLYYLGRSVTLLITIIFTFALVEKFKVSPLLCQVYSVIINVALNFIFSQIFIFLPIPKEKFYYLAKSRESFESLKPGEKTTIFFIVPVYGEHHRMYPKTRENPHGEDFIKVKIDQIKELIKWNEKFLWKLIFVDDNDTKYQSGKLIEGYIGEKYPDLLNKGLLACWYLDKLDPIIARDSRKGGAVIAAMRDLSKVGAKPNDIVIYTDADISSDLRLTGSLLKPLYMVSTVAISSRWHEESTIVNRGIKEKLSSWVYNLLVYIFLRLDFSDTQNGFKAFRMHLIEQLLPYVNDYGFAFDTELLMLIELFDHKISEVPIYWEDSSKETNVNLFKDTFQMIGALKTQRKRKKDLLKMADIKMIKKLSLAATSYI